VIATAGMGDHGETYNIKADIVAGEVAAALKANNGQFDTVKGAARWREDQSAVYKYGAFLVKGKGPGEQKHAWDLFKVEGYQGGDAIMPDLKSLGY